MYCIISASLAPAKLTYLVNVVLLLIAGFKLGEKSTRNYSSDRNIRMHGNARGYVVYKANAFINGLACKNVCPTFDPNRLADWFDIKSIKVYQERYSELQPWDYCVPGNLNQFLHTFVRNLETLYCYKLGYAFYRLYTGGARFVWRFPVVQWVSVFDFIVMQCLNAKFGRGKIPLWIDKKLAYKFLFRSVVAMIFVLIHVLTVEFTASAISVIVYHTMNILSELVTIPQPIEIDILHLFLPSLISPTVTLMWC